MKKMTWLRMMIGGVAAASLLVVAAPANATPTKVAPRPANAVQSVLASCSYSTNNSQGFNFAGFFFQGFGYAGHYNGLTQSPSKTQVTSSGVEAQCLLVRYGDYNPGPIDGVFGSRSQAAMTSFQQDMNAIFGAGLAEDGMPGPASWKWLRWWEQ
jgi:peptidoglycan hydrolase-like protein with peptidoglycan-binding domain